jgi:hypothetical protein
MFFKEFEEMKGHQSLLFLTGVTIVFFGVYLIATSQSNDIDLTSSDAPSVVFDDKIRDPERGEVELQRKRSDSNVMIITCIGSPFKCEKKKVGSKKRHNNNINNSNSNSNNNSNCSSKSSSSDDCDRYYEDLMPVRAALEALEGDDGEGVSNKLESEGRGSSKRSKEKEKDTSEICTLLPSPAVRGASVNPMHVQSAQTTSPHVPSGPLSALSALLSPLGFTSRDDLAPSLFGSASTSFKSRESKAENITLSPKESLSRTDASAFSPIPRSDTRAPAVLLRDRSMSSCGLLELIVDEGDDEI